VEFRTSKIGPTDRIFSSMQLATVKARTGERVPSALTQTQATEYPAGENDLPSHA
jgi:hypothetical protein